MKPIQFFIEDVSLNLSHKGKLRTWLTSIASEYGYEINQLNYIYCSDNYLLDINKTYLNHDYYTDIITFDQREDLSNTIEADIFISIDRVKENAQEQNLPWKTEMHRVMIHGLLHLLGFDDKTLALQQEMRKTEDACLSLLQD